MSKQVESKLAGYLESVGLQFHPFDKLEASVDPRLNSYLIGHEAAKEAWKSKDCSLVGESGSGRTAIAERLLYNCRVGSDKTELFPICLRGDDLNSDQIVVNAIRSAGVEALLELAYQPWKFEDLGDEDRADLVGAIELAVPGILDQFLPQIEKSGSLIPLAEFTDLPASTLPGKAKPERVRKMARQMQELNQPENLAGRPSSSILDIIPAILGLTEIKLIADFSTVPNQKQLMEFNRFHDRLSQRNIVSKVILAPAGPESSSQKTELINWTPKQLVNVLRDRITTASENDFDSLRGIGDPGLAFNIEDKIVTEATDRGHRTPRAVLSLAKTMLELQAQSGDRPLISAATFQEAVKKEFAASV